MIVSRNGGTRWKVDGDNGRRSRNSELGVAGARVKITRHNIKMVERHFPQISPKETSSRMW